MIILFVLYNLFLHGDVLAGPLPPLHSTLEISSHPREINPNKFTQRSEWNIVWSCLATIFTCSWVAIHPNIPASSDSCMRIFVRRLMVMGYMLIAPEMVIGWAARQWCAARAIAKKHKDQKWTKRHAFFALMGGFVLYEDGVMTETPEVRKLAKLASEGKIDWPSISEKEIQDRSKGDAFSKAFAILQTLWFIAQCIARGAAGLTITELELTTLAFAALNGVLYFLWWNKPLDVACPVPIHLRPSKREAGMQTTHSNGGETSHHDIPQRNSNSSYMTLTLSFDDFDDQELSHTDDSLSATKKTESTPLLKPFFSTSFRHFSAFTRFRAYFCRKFKDMGFVKALIHIFIIKPLLIFWGPVDDMGGCYSIAVDDRAPLSVPTFYSPPALDIAAGLIGGGVGVLFGGIHCIGWSFGFQSVEEKYVWRISAVTITSIPCLFLIEYFFSNILPELDSDDRIIQSVKSCFGYLQSDRIGKYITTGIKYFAMVAVVAYCVSRTALLIIPLLALRSLPPESLLDIKWSAFIPHI